MIWEWLVLAAWAVVGAFAAWLAVVLILAMTLRPMALSRK